MGIKNDGRWFTPEMAARHAYAFCEKNTNWQLYGEVPDGIRERLGLDWTELPASLRAIFEREYHSSAEAAWREFGSCKPQRYRYGFISGEGVFYDEVTDIPFGHNFAMVVQTGGKAGAYYRGGRWVGSGLPRKRKKPGIEVWRITNSLPGPCYDRGRNKLFHEGRFMTVMIHGTEYVPKPKVPAEPNWPGQISQHYSESDLAVIVCASVSATNWRVGAAASSWVRRFARGRDLGDFAVVTGLKALQVEECQAVYEKFKDIAGTLPNLEWVHFKVALQWDDAIENLRWADRIMATPAEMRAYRRANNSDDEAAAE